MPFKKGNPGTLRKGQTANLNGRPKGKTKTGLIPAAKKLTPTLIRELEKMAIGTNVPWAIKLEANQTLLAYGWGKPPQTQALQHSGPTGEPLAASSASVIIVKNMHEVEALTSHNSEEDTVVILPSNGYEVTGAELKEDDDPDPRFPSAGKPMFIERSPSAETAEAERPIEQISDAELLRLAASHGIKVKTKVSS